MSVSLFSVWSWICSAAGKINLHFIFILSHTEQKKSKHHVHSTTSSSVSLCSSVLSFFLSADVILDPMTNYPWLLLSEDQRMVQEGLSEADLPYSSQRFNSRPCVLGWEGYNSGRHYWEVDIANNGYWRVGLTTADSKRHDRFLMTPKQGYWALWRSTQQFYACTKPETVLPIGLVPRRVGIYLDYEEGQISFYNAETKSHIYTFTGTFQGKLYPLFSPLDGRTLMRIIPPHKISVN